MRAKISLAILVCLSLPNSGLSQRASSAKNASKVSRAARQADTLQRFRLDASQSKFIAHAQRGGLLWFKGHEHLVAAREFTGEARLRRNR